MPCPWIGRKVEKAIATIELWMELCDRAVYHSISGGKDSLVAGHLIRQLYPNCPMVWINQGPLAEWPDCIELLELLKTQGWNIIELCPSRSLLALYAEHGIPLEGRMNSAADKLINKALVKDVIADWHEQQTFRGYSLGLRKESRGRSLLIQSKGTLFQRKDEYWECLPVGFWSTTDIWHYIDLHRIPYPAMYDLDRMTVRNGPPIGTTGSNRGRLSHLRKHHPEFWNAFVAHFPEVRNYG